MPKQLKAEFPFIEVRKTVRGIIWGEKSEVCWRGQVKFDIPIKVPSEDMEWDVGYISLKPRGEFRL